MCATIWKHIKSWPELYVALPLALAAIPGSALAVYYLTGRAPAESVQWMVDLVSRVLIAVLVIVFLSFTRQASGIWMTKEEQFAHPYQATLQMLMKMFCIGVFVWLFTH